MNIGVWGIPGLVSAMAKESAKAADVSESIVARPNPPRRKHKNWWECTPQEIKAKNKNKVKSKRKMSKKSKSINRKKK